MWWSPFEGGRKTRLSLARAARAREQDLVRAGGTILCYDYCLPTFTIGGSNGDAPAPTNAATTHGS